jgi:hypothetical protein
VWDLNHVSMGLNLASGASLAVGEVAVSHVVGAMWRNRSITILAKFPFEIFSGITTVSDASSVYLSFQVLLGVAIT